MFLKDSSISSFVQATLANPAKYRLGDMGKLMADGHGAPFEPSR
jgi:hypothetical protein